MMNIKKLFFALAIAVLTIGATASCCKYGKDADKPVELSSGETATCYVVSVGNVREAEVLWESFGSMVEPNAGDLVSEVRFEDGKIIFNASGKKGNAVIAAKDGTGTILWSWHIWMTDKPREQV